MSAIRKMITSSTKNKVILALVGLANSGKNILANKIIAPEDCLYATVPKEPNVEFQMHGDITIINWTLNDSIPQNLSLWNRLVLGADALFFVMDSTNSKEFPLNQRLIGDLADRNSPIHFLVLASKAHLDYSASKEELTVALNLPAIDQKKCKCELVKYSALTGEGLIEISNWLDKHLFKKQERIINYAEIKASVLLDEARDENAV